MSIRPGLSLEHSGEPRVIVSLSPNHAIAIAALAEQLGGEVLTAELANDLRWSAKAAVSSYPSAGVDPLCWVCFEPATTRWVAEVGRVQTCGDPTCAVEAVALMPMPVAISERPIPRVVVEAIHQPKKETS